MTNRKFPDYWYEVPCPHCDAKVGEPCKNPNGSKYTYTHAKRYRAKKREEEKNAVR